MQPAPGDRTRAALAITRAEVGLGDWVDRPLVNVDPDSMPFWDGLREHQFRLCRCTRCGSWWYPFTVCNRHDDIPDLDEMVWSAASGQGVVFSKAVVHQVIDASYAAEVPYVLAIVEMDEGPLVPCRLVGSDPMSWSIGDRVAVRFLTSDVSGHRQGRDLSDAYGASPLGRRVASVRHLVDPAADDLAQDTHLRAIPGSPRACEDLAAMTAARAMPPRGRRRPALNRAFPAGCA